MLIQLYFYEILECCCIQELRLQVLVEQNQLVSGEVPLVLVAQLEQFVEYFFNLQIVGLF